MKIAYFLSLFSLLFMAGCATETYIAVPELDMVVPEPALIVYYGWCGTYYGPWYYGPNNVIVFSAPHNWHGHYYPHPRFEPSYHHHFAPTPIPHPVPPRHNFEPPRHNPKPPNSPPRVPPHDPMPRGQPQPR